MSFKLITLNLWNLNLDVRARMQTADEFLSQRRPDLICMQEVSPLPTGGRPQSDLLGTQIEGLVRFYSSQHKWPTRQEGLATMSRLPVLGFESLMLPEAPGAGGRRVQIVTVEIEGCRVLVANTHLAFRLNQDAERVQQCEAILEYLEQAAQHYDTDSIILTGDFNATPDSAPDKTILDNDLGLRDVFDGSKERETEYTYAHKNPFNKEDGESRWIDFVFVTDGLDVTTSTLGLTGDHRGEFASDHVALEVTFDLKR